MVPSALWKHGHTDREIVDAMVQANKDKALWVSLAGRRGGKTRIMTAARRRIKARPPVNPTIRPNKKKARKRR